METGRNRLECRTCPYEHPIEQTIYSRRNFARVEKEDVFGGPGAWDNAQKQKVQCGNPACNGDEAAYFSVQIRSADEPMTVSGESGDADGFGWQVLTGTTELFQVYDLWTPLARLNGVGMAIDGVWDC